jgi:tRNA A-37 threonylcarbamoyl transferase component Bud32
VALKQILDQHADDPGSRQRFLIEAEITGGLEHPGIVPVYGLGTYGDGRPYYAMRFIRGDSLKEAIEGFHAHGTSKKDSGRQSLDQRKLLRRFMDVCNALEYAHTRGVLHRDIKPGNIIVGKHGETFLVDWGLAKATGRSEPGAAERTLMPSSASGSAETLPGSALGTPAYMSPEQAAGDLDCLGPRSDVYSLGATLYFLLTGKPPQEGDDVGELLRRVRQGDFARPRQLSPSIDPALEAICLKAMATKPEDRYPSCRALAEDVERWAADEPVTAWREPFGRRARRWMRRNRTVVAAVVVALVAGVVGLGTVAGVQARANSTLRKANKATEKALGETQEAKKATEVALAESEESRRQAKAINEFLTQDLLTQAEPANNAAEDHVTLLEVLDRAAERVGKRFADQPELESALRDTIFRTYHGLASWGKAENQVRAMLEAARRRDPSSAEVYYAQSELAHILRHRRGPDAEVLKLAETAAEGLKRTGGPEHDDTLAALAILAQTYEDAGKLPEATALFERVRDALIARNGPDHRDTLLTINNLATAYSSAGKYLEAIALHERVRDAQIAHLGPDHPDTLLTISNLASAYWRTKQLDKSVPLFEDVFKRQVARLGRQRSDTQMTVANLGINYKDSGRLREAIPLLEEAYHASDKFPDLRWVGGPLLDSYAKAGRPTEVEKMAPEYLAVIRNTTPKDSPQLEVALTWCGSALLQVKAYAAAEPILRERLAIREKTTPDSWITAAARSMLGGALLGQKKLTEAEPLLLAAYQGMKQREAIIPPERKSSLTKALEYLIQLYEATNEPDEAARRRKELEATRKAEEPPQKKP